MATVICSSPEEQVKPLVAAPAWDFKAAAQALSKRKAAESWSCPLKTCRFTSSTQQDLDEHVLQKHPRAQASRDAKARLGLSYSSAARSIQGRTGAAEVPSLSEFAGDAASRAKFRCPASRCKWCCTEASAINRHVAEAHPRSQAFKKTRSGPLDASPWPTAEHGGAASPPTTSAGRTPGALSPASAEGNAHATSVVSAVASREAVDAQNTWGQYTPLPEVATTSEISQAVEDVRHAGSEDAAMSAASLLARTGAGTASLLPAQFALATPAVATKSNALVVGETEEDVRRDVVQDTIPSVDGTTTSSAGLEQQCVDVVAAECEQVLPLVGCSTSSLRLLDEPQTAEFPLRSMLNEIPPVDNAATLDLMIIESEEELSDSEILSACMALESRSTSAPHEIVKHMTEPAADPARPSRLASADDLEIEAMLESEREYEAYVGLPEVDPLLEAYLASEESARSGVSQGVTLLDSGSSLAHDRSKIGAISISNAPAPIRGSAGSLQVGSGFKSAEVGHWASACPAVPVQGTGLAPSFNIPSSGSNFADACRVTGECLKCGQSGHWARDCPCKCGFRCKWRGGPCQSAGISANDTGQSHMPASSPQGGLPQRNTSTCFKCGEAGHWASSCPGKSSISQRSRGSGSGECFRCGQADHWARDCPSGR